MVLLLVSTSVIPAILLPIASFSPSIKLPNPCSVAVQSYVLPGMVGVNVTPALNPVHISGKSPPAEVIDMVGVGFKVKSTVNGVPTQEVADVGVTLKCTTASALWLDSVTALLIGPGDALPSKSPFPIT